MTGDAIAQNTVLKCADIDDLLANPATWATRWGLDDAGRTGLDPAYCVNDNLSPTTGLPTDSAYRTTSLAFDGGYVYWGMDASPYAIYKQHLATGVRTALGNSIGVAWRWLKTAAGDLIFAADSEYAHIGSDADENVRLYAVNAARTGLVVLRVWPRDDAAAPVGNVQFGNSLFQTAAGVIYATCYPGYIGPIKGKDVAGVILPAGTDIREWLAETPTTLTLSRTMTQAARTNFVREPLFATVATWTAAAGCTMAQEAVVVPDGIASSAKATPDASVTESYIYFDFGSTGNLGLYFPKRTLSLTVKVWLPAEQHGGQAPAIQIYNGAAASNLLMLPVADFDGAWHEYTLVTTIVTGATRPLVRLYAHKGAADAAAVDPIYWTDVRCGWGCEALPSRA